MKGLGYHFVWFLFLWLTVSATFFLYLYSSQLKEQLEELKISVNKYEADINALLMENKKLDNAAEEYNKMNSFLTKENEVLKVNDAHHEKTDLEVFVVVIPKEGWRSWPRRSFFWYETNF